MCLWVVANQNKYSPIPRTGILGAVQWLTLGLCSQLFHSYSWGIALMVTNESTRVIIRIPFLIGPNSAYLSLNIIKILASLLTYFFCIRKRPRSKWSPSPYSPVYSRLLSNSSQLYQLSFDFGSVIICFGLLVVKRSELPSSPL